MTAENYPAWLLARAHLLATVSNSFLAELRGSGKGARIEAAA
jgi:hypothetical protein